MPTSPIISRKVAAAAGCLLCSALSTGVLAQGLPTLPGLTPLQQPTANNIQGTCVEITAGQGVAPNPNGTAIQRLANSCTLMVSTAFYLEGQVPPFDPDGKFDLRISNQRLRQGVQAISPVQMNAQKQMSTEAAKMNQIGVRLLDLRGGSRGFVANVNGESTVAAATPAKTFGLDGATGGGAAADSPLGGGPWGGFMNIAYSWGDVDQTDLQDAYKYDNVNILAGADYRVSDSLVLGAAITYSDTRSDYQQSLGNIKAQTTGVIGYASFYKDNWFVDGFVSYGHASYDSTRVIFIPSNNPAAPAINATATASPKGDQWSASVGVGANYPMGSVTATPSLRLGYIWVENDAFNEDEPVAGLGLAVQSRTIRSVQTALGGKLSTTLSTSAGVFVPYAYAAWMHEFENDNPSIVSRYVSDPTSAFFAIPTANPTRDYAILMAGSSATFANNFSGFFQLSAAVGLNNETNYGAVLGIRKQF